MCTISSESENASCRFCYSVFVGLIITIVTALIAGMKATPLDLILDTIWWND
jgi:hypothetical protein